MTDLAPRRQLDIIHHEGYDPDRPGPYVPAIRVPYGVPVYISGLTAAPPYHEHPHRPETFDGIPADIEGQVELLFHHLDLSLAAAGCERRHIVVMNRFFTHVADDQNIVNAYQKEWFGGHIPTSTSVGIVQLATDPRPASRDQRHRGRRGAAAVVVLTLRRSATTSIRQRKRRESWKKHAPASGGSASGGWGRRWRRGCSRRETM